MTDRPNKNNTKASKSNTEIKCFKTSFKNLKLICYVSWERIPQFWSIR